MEFKKYPSLHNLESSNVKEMVASVSQNSLWHVLEKNHGSNISMTSDGNKCIPGSRNKFLEQKDLVLFYHSEVPVNACAAKVTELHKMLKVEFPDLQILRVFGEMFGGFYPTETKPKPKQTDNKPVQQEIMYSPTIEISVFDINLDGVWLSKTDCIKWCQTVKLLYVPILFSGTFEQCVEFSNSHLCEDSTIPSWFNLPPLKNPITDEPIPNIREGHVIQPDKPHFYKMHRVYIKHKNLKWKECAFGVAKAEKNRKSEKKEIDISEAVDLICLNRLKNLISHDIPPTSWRQMIGPMITDVMKELCQEDCEFKKLLGVEVCKLLPSLFLQLNL